MPGLADELAEAGKSQPLGSWKEIANYLKRDERTVRRWEKEGLPVHRHMHKKRASVYAFRSEIDVWWKNGQSRLELAEAAATGKRRTFTWLIAAGLTVAAI